MALLKLKPEGLFTPQVCYDVPSKKEALAEILKTHALYTDPEKTDGKIFSGYRRQVLAREGLGPSKMLAQKLRSQFQSMVVLGIGGSALGAKTVLSALQWTVAESERKQVFIAENLDPIDFEQMWSKLNLEKTCFAVVTKSGGTLETLAQMSVVMDRLQKAGLAFQKHIVAITDPKKGALRTWAESHALATLDVPSDVGGRFSVMTPVGLLPLAFAGIDVDAVVDGAVQFFKGEVVTQESMAEFSGRLAELEIGGFAGHVMMPYSTVLRDFGAWFVQLWGESLGKVKIEGNSTRGSIPIAAVGATDQHSLLQLLVEGPNRLVTGFISVMNWPQIGGRPCAMQKLSSEFAGLSFAFGRTFGEILNAEKVATETVLREQRGRPVYTIELAELTAQSMGALLAFYMDATVYTAAALRVNPFDQPGVEHGKIMMPKILAV